MLLLQSVRSAITGNELQCSVNKTLNNLSLLATVCSEAPLRSALKESQVYKFIYLITYLHPNVKHTDHQRPSTGLIIYIYARPQQQ